jgi:hypothetical protein
MMLRVDRKKDEESNQIVIFGGTPDGCAAPHLPSFVGCSRLPSEWLGTFRRFPGNVHHAAAIAAYEAMAHLAVSLEVRVFIARNCQQVHRGLKSDTPWE